MQKLNRREMIDIVAEKARISKRDDKAAIDTTVDLMREALLNGTEVNITNFGVFTPKQRVSRDGTDPKTHQRIEIKSKKTISFRVSKAFKDELN